MERRETKRQGNSVKVAPNWVTSAESEAGPTGFELDFGEISFFARILSTSVLWLFRGEKFDGLGFYCRRKLEYDDSTYDLFFFVCFVLGVFSYFMRIQSGALGKIHENHNVSKNYFTPPENPKSL